MGLEQLNDDEDISLVTYRVHPGANIHNWKNKVQTSFDGKPILMIHNFNYICNIVFILSIVICY